MSQPATLPSSAEKTERFPGGMFLTAPNIPMSEDSERISGEMSLTAHNAPADIAQSTIPTSPLVAQFYPLLTLPRGKFCNGLGTTHVVHVMFLPHKPLQEMTFGRRRNGFGWIE